MYNPISQPYFQCERLDVYRIAVKFHRSLVPLRQVRGAADLRDQLLRASESIVQVSDPPPRIAAQGVLAARMLDARLDARAYSHHLASQTTSNDADGPPPPLPGGLPRRSLPHERQVANAIARDTRGIASLDASRIWPSGAGNAAIRGGGSDASSPKAQGASAATINAAFIASPTAAR